MTTNCQCWWIVVQWLGCCLGNHNGCLLASDGSWSATMMLTQNEMMNMIKNNMATYNCHTMMMIDTTYTKMKPWPRRKKTMCNYHCTTNLLTQNETKNRREKNYGHLPTCDCHTTMMIDFAYTNETMNKKEKNDGHLPLHDHCTTTMINYVQCLHKMKTWIGGKKIMGTCSHRVA